MRDSRGAVRGAALAVAALLLTAVAGKSAGEEEFSLDEFYDIKRSISKFKTKQASRALQEARVISGKLHSSLPKAPTFYGQDHYEQSFDERGQESWTHVGRPVRARALPGPLRAVPLRAPHARARL
jgi:hypothetical protein